MSELCTLEIDNGVATVTLRREDARNALSLALLDALRKRLAELARSEDARVAVLAGAGKAFCAGMDLKAVLHEPGAPARLLESIAEATIALRDLPVPTIAKVQRAAIGGGCGLMCVCDFAVTHPDAKIGYPEVDLGVCPAVVAPWLVNKIGAGAARRVLLSGGTMTGEAAHALGLASHLAAADDLDTATADLAARLASGGPTAVRATKAWLNEVDGPRLADLVRRGAEISARVVESEEARASLTKALGG